MGTKFVKEGLSFDDVLVVPAKSDVLPSQVSTVTRLTNNIRLSVPICSSPMDTVTDATLAIAIAREGGIGFIHRNFTTEQQISEVDRVKRSESGMIVDPKTLPPNRPIREALELMAHHHISGIPVTEEGRLVGIITNRDLKYPENLDQLINEKMTSEGLITAPVGTTLEEAKKILHETRKEKLPIVDENFTLRGLITIKDIDKIEQYPRACKDSSGRLRTGAAVGASGDLEEVRKLVDAGADVIAIDTAHGHTTMVIAATEKIKSEFPNVELIAGNVATAEATRDLIEAGADAVKVGMGPGSICTTRVIAGIGVPQITAIHECATVADKYGIPIIADGGIRYSGDIVKAIAVGASCVMIGSLFAGTEESPGEMVIYQGRSYKEYRAMASVAALKERGGRERYFREENAPMSFGRNSALTSETKDVPEGIEGRVPYKGKLSDLVFQLVGGLRLGMGYCGAKDVETLRTESKLIRITSGGLKESHPHDVVITEEAPNYSPGS